MKTSKEMKATDRRPFKCYTIFPKHYNMQIFSQQHEPFKMKKVINITDIQNETEALFCLHFVYLYILYLVYSCFGFSF